MNLARTDIQVSKPGVYGSSMFVTLGFSRIPSSTIVVVCYENTGAVYGSIFLRARWVRGKLMHKTAGDYIHCSRRDSR